MDSILSMIVMIIMVIMFMSDDAVALIKMPKHVDVSYLDGNLDEINKLRVMTCDKLKDTYKLSDKDKQYLMSFLHMCFKKATQNFGVPVTFRVELATTQPVCKFFWRHHHKLFMDVAKIEAMVSSNRLLAPRGMLLDVENVENVLRSLHGKKAISAKGVIDARQSSTQHNQQLLESVSTATRGSLSVRDAPVWQGGSLIETEVVIQGHNKRQSLLQEQDRAARNPVLTQRHTGFDLSFSNSLWPDGVVYFKMSKSLRCMTRAWVERAMREWERLTCVRFRRHDTFFRKSYINIMRGKGCFSSVGDESTVPLFGHVFKSRMGLSKLCPFQSILHEVGHTLGMRHTQSRSDRDKYIHVDLDNVKRGNKHNFKVRKDWKTLIPYDYDSIMHYGPWSFNKTAKPTIYAKRKGIRFGQREHLSPGDIELVNAVYKCRREKCEAPYVPSKKRPGLCLTPGTMRAYCEANGECVKGLNCHYNRCYKDGAVSSTTSSRTTSSSSSSSSSGSGRSRTPATGSSRRASSHNRSGSGRSSTPARGSGRRSRRSRNRSGRSSQPTH